MCSVKVGRVNSGVIVWREGWREARMSLCGVKAGGEIRGSLCGVKAGGEIRVSLRGVKACE